LAVGTCRALIAQRHPLATTEPTEVDRPQRNDRGRDRHGLYEHRDRAAAVGQALAGPRDWAPAPLPDGGDLEIPF
jgi:hypothetical protein